MMRPQPTTTSLNYSYNQTTMYDGQQAYQI